jgi:hypothetical protein
MLLVWAVLRGGSQSSSSTGVIERVFAETISKFYYWNEWPTVTILFSHLNMEHDTWSWKWILPINCTLNFIISLSWPWILNLLRTASRIWFSRWFYDNLEIQELTNNKRISKEADVWFGHTGQKKIYNECK